MMRGLITITQAGGIWKPPSAIRAQALSKGYYGTSTGATDTLVGAGRQNTITIENVCTTPGTPADICANLSLGGYEDWFLPSKDELNLMYENLYNIDNPVGGFNPDGYWWSSSEIDPSIAWSQGFGYDEQLYSNKDNSF